MRQTDRAQEGRKEEKWSSEWTRSLRKCLAGRNGSPRNAGVLEFAKRTGGSKTSSRTLTEFTLTDPCPKHTLNTSGGQGSVCPNSAPSGFTRQQQQPQSCALSGGASTTEPRHRKMCGYLVVTALTSMTRRPSQDRDLKDNGWR